MNWTVFVIIAFSLVTGFCVWWAERDITRQNDDAMLGGDDQGDSHLSQPEGQ